MPMLVIDTAHGTLHSAWKVQPGPLPDFLEAMRVRGDLLVSGPEDYMFQKPVPFLDGSGSTKIGIFHLDPLGVTVWDFANAGDFIVYKTHYYTDEQDAQVFEPAHFHNRFQIYKA